ncbi:hypothetical protein HELRODRAFT_194171 [Helobdella robusta]|uniref:Arb2 domain-containing protein n=1 Tax=Helobdella robusta TaxID=6412 RepID=T1FVS1_HELRO|nr:hypothetical protein HELRODRAFT_194171 [Helobdella robusta]ESN93155.1 hypothetical protein HELRODRAFT_194171 [Helobdella robusta]
MNDSLMDGSQIPYIKQASDEHYDVIVLNTNLNYQGNHLYIRGSESPEKHANYIWENYIMPNKNFRQTAIVAHSYGGKAKNQKESFLKRVFAVAFTDAAVFLEECDEETREFFKNNSQNWVAGTGKLDEPVITDSADVTCPKVSAGHTEHVWTSATSMSSIFKYFKKKSDEWNIETNASFEIMKCAHTKECSEECDNFVLKYPNDNKQISDTNESDVKVDNTLILENQSECISTYSSISRDNVDSTETDLLINNLVNNVAKVQLG